MATAASMNGATVLAGPVRDVGRGAGSPDPDLVIAEDTGAELPSTLLGGAGHRFAWIVG
jgi:hypothetical protein